MFKVQKKLTSLLLLFIMVLGSISGHLVTAKAADSRPEGFVYAQGTKFMCDGSPYYYGGTNCYYLIYKSKTEVNNVIEDASDMGIKVIRAWGHLDVGTKTGKPILKDIKCLRITMMDQVKRTGCIFNILIQN